ncbi:MAG: hypothetical protein WC916_00820 [Candidatus Woesearchaeota archaeon]
MKFTVMSIMIIILVGGLVLVVGCKTTKTGTTVIPVDTEKTYGELYRFSDVSTYSYRLTTKLADGDVNTTVESSVKSETLYGASVWVQDSTSNGVTTRIWLDATKFSCLKMAFIQRVQDTDRLTSVSCPLENSAQASAVAVKYIYAGSEKVTVPLGTFDALKYASADSTYWYVTTIPVPVKAVSNYGVTIMELASYS